MNLPRRGRGLRHRIALHCRALCFRALFGIVLCCVGFARTASAFDLEEHLEVGRRGYLAACEGLLSTDSNQPPEAQRRLKEIACYQHENLALHYGQFVGLSGDHVDRDQLGTVHGDIAAENLFVYLQLAIQNADHFFPANVSKYEEVHNIALDLAVQAAQLSPGADGWLQIRRQFWLAFYASAFADHFLQDTFAAGHGGFNRPASTPAASRVYHNNANHEGVLLRDGSGRIWVSYGDGRLNLGDPTVDDAERKKAREYCWPALGLGPVMQRGRLCKPNAEAADTLPAHWRGKSLLIAATRESVRDVLAAFVYGKRSAVRERAVALRVPSDCLGSERSGCTPSATITAQFTSLGKPQQQALRDLGRLGPPDILHAEANVTTVQRVLERCELRSADECKDAPQELERQLGLLRLAYAAQARSLTDRGYWAPALAAQDPARLEMYVGGEWFYFGRLGPERHLTGSAAGLRFYTPLAVWGPRLGYYWRANEPGFSDRGLVVGTTVGFPLGTRYGSVLSWEATFRPTLFQPLKGPERVTYVALPIGGQLGVQFGPLTLGLQAAYSPTYSRQTGPQRSREGWGHGWESALSISWGFKVDGGGLKRAPPF